MKRRKTDFWLWGTFAVFGLVFMVVGMCIFVPLFTRNGREETTAVIEKVTNHRTYVSYSVEGQPYESALNGYSSSFYPGKEIKIYYDREDPRDIGCKTFDLLMLIFPGVGAIFFLIGGTGVLAAARNRGKAKRLKESGRMVYAAYAETVCNFSYTVNGRHPYNVVCHWRNPEDGKTYLFKSGNIWMNPEPIIRERDITVFPVYMDPGNVKRYTVDTDMLTANAVDLR